MQGGHRWYLWDADGTGTEYGGGRYQYPPATGDGGVWCLDCRLSYIPCSCFFCAGRPLAERALDREPNLQRWHGVQISTRLIHITHPISPDWADDLPASR